MSAIKKTTLDDFEVICPLGKGSFGSVSKVKRLMDQQFYVIKSIPITELSYKEQSESINEVKILSQMDSPYVVKYLDSFIQSKCLYIVMEYCDKGDLQKLIKKAKSKDMSCIKENVVWNIILQVILGLYYIHSKKVLHRDLKSANVFLKKPSDNFCNGNNNSNDTTSKTFFDVKIGDLGVSKLLESSTAFAQTIVGTPYYLSPELCSDAPYRDKSDCWALGILVYECCTLKHPFEAKNQFALIMKILRAQYEPLNDKTSSKYMCNLVTWLLQKNPAQRPTIRDLLCEEYVRLKLEQNSFTLPPELEEGEVLVTDYLSDLSQLSSSLLLTTPPVSPGLNDSTGSNNTPAAVRSNSSRSTSPRDNNSTTIRGSGKGSDNCDYDREAKWEMNGADYIYDDENEDGNHSTYSDASQFKTAVGTIITNDDAINKRGGGSTIRISQEETKIETKEDDISYYHSYANVSGKNTINALSLRQNTGSSRSSNNSPTRNAPILPATTAIRPSTASRIKDKSSSSSISDNKNHRGGMLVSESDSNLSPRVICVSKSLPHPPPLSSAPINPRQSHQHQQQMVKDTALIKGGGRVRGNNNKNIIISSVARTRHQVTLTPTLVKSPSAITSSSSSSSSRNLQNQQQRQQQQTSPTKLTKNNNNNNSSNIDSNNATNTRESKLCDDDNNIESDTFIRRSNKKFDAKCDPDSSYDDSNDDGINSNNNNDNDDEDDYGDVAPRDYQRINSNYKKYNNKNSIQNDIEEEEEDSFDEFLDTFGVAGRISSGRDSSVDNNINNNNSNNSKNNNSKSTSSNIDDFMEVEDEYSTSFNTFNSNSSSSGMMKGSLEDSQETNDSGFGDGDCGDNSYGNNANNNNSSNSSYSSEDKYSGNQYDYILPVAMIATSEYKADAKTNNTIGSNNTNNTNNTFILPSLPRPPQALNSGRRINDTTNNTNTVMSEEKLQRDHYFNLNENDDWKHQQQLKDLGDDGDNNALQQQFGVINYPQNENEEFVKMANRTRNKLLSDLGVDLFRKVYNLLKGLSNQDELLHQPNDQYLTADSRIIQELQHRLSEQTHFSKIEDLCSSVNRVKLLLALEQQPQMSRNTNSR